MTTYLDTLNASEEEFMKKLVAGKVDEAELKLHSSFTLYMRSSIASCIEMLGGTTPVKAISYRAYAGKIQEILESNRYTEEGKGALRKLLRI